MAFVRLLWEYQVVRVASLCQASVVMALRQQERLLVWVGLLLASVLVVQDTRPIVCKN